MFTRVLIANRGEIARRVIRACRALGIETVAVFSEADAGAAHVTEADQAVAIGPSPAAASYLNIDAILAAARVTAATAIHPGYGFLAENAEFARRCEASGIVFIGPPADVIAQMGDKVSARQLVASAGVPVVPGTSGYLAPDPAEAEAQAHAVGYPLFIKAAAGGGGIGMVHVAAPDQLRAGLTLAHRRAQQAFGNGGLYVERAVNAPRHIEVQVLGDNHGTIVHLFERECSVQRRHQKVIEEAPSQALDVAARRAITDAAVTAARAVRYRSAGTVEFIVDGDRRFYFLEMNTRIQVEHPVTEMITGVDLVQEQIKIAAGEPTAVRQETLTVQGHAIECRIYAEDPVTFFPSPGTITRYEEPAGEGVRVESWVKAGQTITPFYDPLIAKIIVWQPTRAAAIASMRSALARFQIEGVKTNIPLHDKILTNGGFVAGDYDVTLLTSPAWRG
jgi:acetyl-CoA carboxylase, biotin carboxylase subunit